MESLKTKEISLIAADSSQEQPSRKRRLVITAQGIEKHRSQGMTFRNIANHYGTSERNLYRIVNRSKLPSPQPTVPVVASNPPLDQTTSGVNLWRI